MSAGVAARSLQAMLQPRNIEGGRAARAKQRLTGARWGRWTCYRQTAATKTARTIGAEGRAAEERA
eukprot:COSAG01_NODE_6731_length_3524_cov_10.057963_2_plen_66_part_00